MNTNFAFSRRGGRRFGTGYLMKPRRLAGNLPGVLLWLAALPLAAFGQANYATPYTIITLAGRAGYGGSADGMGSTARFFYPIGVAVDIAGNVYVSDYDNATIRKVTPAAGNWVVTTLAGRAGVVGGMDGTNSAGLFNGPDGVAVDTNANVYVADELENTIRKVTPVGTNWVVTTLAGMAGVAGSADGTNSDARFNGPIGLAMDSAGNLYVGEWLNYTIRKVTPVGTNWVVTTLAGMAGVPGSADGTNSAARFNAPVAVAVGMAGNLYVGDYSNNTIRIVTPVGTNWVVTTLAGKTGVVGSADGTNSGARFNSPHTVTADAAGNVYVADCGNNTIRKVTPVGTNWVVTTLAGMASVPGSVDGTGSTARFRLAEAGSYSIGGVAVDNAGNLYVADSFNHTIRKGFPASSVPSPTLRPPSLSVGQFGFGITGLPGLAVNIESSTNLSSWQLSTAFILVGGTNYYSVTPNATQGAQFYRAQVR